MCILCEETVKLLEMTLPKNGGGIVRMKLETGPRRTRPVLERPDGRQYLLKRKEDDVT